MSEYVRFLTRFKEMISIIKYANSRYRKPN